MQTQNYQLIRAAPLENLLEPKTEIYFIYLDIINRYKQQFLTFLGTGTGKYLVFLLGNLLSKLLFSHDLVTS